VIIPPPSVLDILNFIVGAERRAERDKIGWSEAMSRRCGKKMIERSGRSRSRNGAESGSYRNRLELLSHALLADHHSVIVAVV